MHASIDAVRVAGPSGPVPVVVLAVDDEEDVIPIFIGFDEATSIARGLEAEDIGRPLTHDLLLDVIEELGSRIDRVVVSEIEARADGRGGTYIADLRQDSSRRSSSTPGPATRSLWPPGRTPPSRSPRTSSRTAETTAKFDELKISAPLPVNDRWTTYSGCSTSSRTETLPEGSYTASLFTHEKGENAVLETRETTELVLAAKDDDRDEVAYEAADIVYHLLVLLSMKEMELSDLEAELEARR